MNDLDLFRTVRLTREIRRFRFDWRIGDFGLRCKDVGDTGIVQRISSPAFRVRNVYSCGGDILCPELLLSVNLDLNWRRDSFCKLDLSATLRTPEGRPIYLDFLAKLDLRITDCFGQEKENVKEPNYSVFRAEKGGRKQLELFTIGNLASINVNVEMEFARDISMMHVQEQPQEKKSILLLQDELRNFLATKELADIELTSAEGKCFSSHRLVLAARSDVFRAMFRQTEMFEVTSGRVKVEDMTAEVLEAFLTFVTSDEVDWEKNDLDPGQLYAAADKYNVSGLRKLCSERIAGRCDVVSCVEDLVLGHLREDERVFSAAVAVLAANREAVMGTEDWAKMLKGYPGIEGKIIERLIKMSC